MSSSSSYKEDISKEKRRRRQKWDEEQSIRNETSGVHRTDQSPGLSSDSIESQEHVKRAKKPHRKHTERDRDYQDVKSSRERPHKQRYQSPVTDPSDDDENKRHKRKFMRDAEYPEDRERHKHRKHVDSSPESHDDGSGSDRSREHAKKRHKKKHHKANKISAKYDHRQHNIDIDNEYADVHVKEEPSEDEYERKHKDRGRKLESSAGVKQEPSSDNERNERSRRGHGGTDDRQEYRRHKNGRQEENQYHEERRMNDERRKQNRDARRSKWQNSPDDDNMQFGAQGGEDNSATNQQPSATDKEQPNFSLSGKLTEDTNTFRGVVIKYSEPPEARKPKRRWRLYPFKGDQPMPVLHIHRQSAYLLGRERRVADIPLDHPSCSKQHAALQYRLIPYEREDGSKGHKICPYVIDLESANGTYVNNQRIDPKRYVQLLEKDVLKFGFSSREYVILHDSSDTTDLQDEGID